MSGAAVDSRPGYGWREFVVVVASGLILAVVLTYPFALRMAHSGRLDTADGQFSIWNVGWVARTLVVDPLHVYDANIFFPHRWTLAYSENNLGAGVLALPAFWATRNPYFAHNFVVLLALALAATTMYYLSRYLTGDRRAAAVAGICYGYCPFVFSWTAEIQLLMIAGLPLAMLAFHRAADRPTAGRGAALGVAMAAQAACCGYYGVFLIPMIGFAVFVTAAVRRRWTDWEYWSCIMVAAGVAITLVAPLFLPYVALQRTTGFTRPLEEARTYSADWRGYLASSSIAHVWMLRVIRHWDAVAFPGFVASAFGAAGAWLAWKAAKRELLAIYGGLAILTVWASLGPAAGLYTVLYRVVPVFSWLRAPARFAVVPTLCLSVFAGFAIARLLATVRKPAVIALAIATLAALELVVPLRLSEAEPVAPVYRMLSTLPRGGLIEMPFAYERQDFRRDVQYMLASTSHWMPLVNGYSDYIPTDYLQDSMKLAVFPSPEGFEAVTARHVRYALFHLGPYNADSRARLFQWITDAGPKLRLLYSDQETRLYEIADGRP